MNNNRKEHISWTFFFSFPVHLSLCVRLLILIVSSFSAWVLLTSWKTYIASAGGCVFNSRFFWRTGFSKVLWKDLSIELNNLYSESLRAASDTNPGQKHTHIHNMIVDFWEVIDDSWEGWKRSGRVEVERIYMGSLAPSNTCFLKAPFLYAFKRISSQWEMRTLSGTRTWCTLHGPGEPSEL